MGRCFTGPPRLPTFNLTCNVWFGQGINAVPMGGPDLAGVACQLSPGERVSVGEVAGPGIYMWLMVPPRTNIAGDPRSLLSPNGDLIECPAGSGRYYHLKFVDDVGKGFPNEYRFGLMVHGTSWLVPTP